MFRSILMASVVAASLSASAAWSQPAGPVLATPDFIKAAAQTDAFERREGHLAEKRAFDPKVRDFGAMMVRDHTKTTAGLKAAIRKSHMPVPPPPALTDDQVQMLAALKGLHGADFDKAYLDQQVQAHQKALGVMQAYANSGAAPAIRDAAAQTVPLVQHHLQMAQSLSAGR